MSAQRPNQARLTRGFGLIELMIGILIGTFLLLGLSEVFSASRQAFQTSQGASEVQENGRFALDFLERDVRMVGHLGCVNDEQRFLAPLAAPQFFSHFLSIAERGTTTTPPEWAGPTPTNPTIPFSERFDLSIQGFEAANSAPTNTLNLPVTGTWAGSPALPTGSAPFPSGAGIPVPVAGSDILVLRFFGTTSAPVTAINLGANTVTATAPAFVAIENAAPVGMYGIANCVTASVFKATAVDGAGTITAATAAAPGNLSGFSTGENYTNSELTVYPAESMIYYVAIPADGSGRTAPSLFRIHYTANPAVPAVEEVVEGIDNMQILYGRDTTPPGTSLANTPTGAIAEYDTAQTIDALQNSSPYVADPNYAWRHVGSVRIALLARSITRGIQNTTTTTSPSGCPGVANCMSMLGVNVIPPLDGNYREVYTTTIAMRNRLFGQ